MKSRNAVLIFSACLAVLLGGCATDSPSVTSSAQAQQAVRLADRNWDAFNKTELEALINAHGKASPNYDPAKPAYAVFDWDNTMVFLDIEEATLIYQLENLRYGATPAQMDAALRKDVPKGNFGKDYNNAAGQPLNIDLVVPDAIESYTWLYNNYKGLKGTKSLAEVKQSPHYMNFITKVRYLYDAIGGTFDVSVSYPWVLYQFAGMTEKDVRQLVQETADWQLKQPVEKVKWTSPASLPGKAGVVSISWKNGLRLVPEMQDLFVALRQAGIDIWICSASFVDVVKEISSNPKFGYNALPERVIAMELERDAAGRIQVDFRYGYDQTQGKGKTRALERFVVPKYGYGPILVAGDSEGDQNMMQDFADIKTVLIINRIRGSDIGKMSKLAVEQYGKPGAKFLLQGRDDNTGLFLKSQASVPLGAKESKLTR
ncbi:HAD family hydrolase [Pseudothauera rhizosphaerae]|uniref:phosphoserine phosphatase n=1 Tax=Pseudothauera rhizosphaerae TaxID=2565932 RepID=A0A4S4AWM0_9RHOO|nr:haloacid dehalogenase-like hydrolase [Pseudothauera rhizosphaerae]THF64444.1 haloacid dehalogenase-like hydrolase [Pseudothauera rhizosphaerae]